MPPDRIRLKYGTNDKAEDDLVEFVQAGQRVWEYDKSQGWTERPELISVFDKHLERLGGPFGQFECLGPIEFSGKRYAGYRTHRLWFPVGPGQTTKGTSSWRTILVDQETGLLAWDLVTFEEQLDTLKRRTHVHLSRGCRDRPAAAMMSAAVARASPLRPFPPQCGQATRRRVPAADIHGNSRILCLEPMAAARRSRSNCWRRRRPRPRSR